uniref:ATP synthase F0 subunit 8 n=1 Tax=Sperchon placodermus TaxID=3136837 RepID=A0AAU6QDL7_9ACAR
MPQISPMDWFFIMSLNFIIQNIMLMVVTKMKMKKMNNQNHTNIKKKWLKWKW